MTVPSSARAGRRLAALPVPSSPRAVALLPRIAAAIDGDGDALLPVPAGDERETARLTGALPPGSPVGGGVAMVVATSGTTGTPKGALLTGSALAAGARATHSRLGGPGTWLLPLPPHHIAGMQVLVRSVVAGTEPVIVDVARGFRPEALVDAARRMPAGRAYTSLVPTQLVKALDDPAATDALRGFDAILVGGAATPATLCEHAADAGLTLVRTYGMSETCGGCVYDGVPLDGVRVRLEPVPGQEGTGRVLLGGPVLAAGYLDAPDHPAFADPGWFRTDDAGTVDDGVLTITGRLDEAITSGGLTVVPQVVEAVLNRVPGVRECAVVGLPDDRLGERVVVAVVSGAGPAPTLESLRSAVADRLGAKAAPRAMFIVDELPLRGPGKVDRRTLRARLEGG
ncbi:o-succinylbenzoate--CoA ligase [Tomitella fengzijianii]|uniref:O-succinylbenzoate--CoA ligase n=1 Tax=Tomitella fengzijianii TaxID=2597660 RepID=A0A516X096_9ACTN|nr:o-succinylbenzoate--CoA ligase [Tomitella fengzijianii]QDQ96524.1 o-succinylbenzoate--CoA ligase [Tomitella fengzijianii]